MGTGDSEIKIAGGQDIKLGTVLEELSGEAGLISRSKPSPGKVLTEWGFGFHQTAVGEKNIRPTDQANLDKANAVLTAFGKPSKNYSKIRLHLLVDRVDCLGNAVRVA